MMDVRVGKALFPICWLPFCLIDSVFCLTEALKFYDVPLVDFLSYSTSRCCSVQEFFPVPISSRLFPTFSSINFNVSGFMWRSLIHLDLNFVQGDKNASIHILLHDNCQLSQHHLLILYLTAQAIAVLFRNFSPVPISSRLFPTFSSINFNVSGFI